MNTTGAVAESKPSDMQSRSLMQVICFQNLIDQFSLKNIKMLVQKIWILYHH